MLLTDLPWLWCTGAVPTDAPHGPAHRAVGPQPDALARAAAELPARGLVVVVPADTGPWPISSGLSVVPALRAAVVTGDRAVLWPALNTVTATIAADRGLWLVSAGTVCRLAEALVAGTAARTLLPVVPPLIASTWDCAAAPETAFRAGHAEMEAPRDAGLALIAGLGADCPNGDWWGIGAARALLGEDADAAWADAAALLSGDGASRAAHRVELSRQVRVRCGLAVHPLSPQAAAAVRAMRSPVAPSQVWDRYAADLADLLPGGGQAPAAAGARLARNLVWGVDRKDLSAAAQGVQNGT